MSPAEMKALMLSKRSEIDSKSKRTNIATFKDGATRIRILRGWKKDDAGTFWHPFGQHFIKGADGQIKAVFNCLDKTFDMPCPVCSGISKTITETDDDDVIKLLEGAKANSARYLVNALILNREGVDPTKPVVLGLPGTVYDQIVKSFFEVDEDTGEEVFVDLTSSTEGRTITVERTGTGVTNTKYTVRVAGKSTVLANATAVEAQIIDLDDFVKQEAEGQTKRALDAIGSISGLILSAPAHSSEKQAKIGKAAEYDEDAEDDALRMLESPPKKSELASRTATAIDVNELDAVESATAVSSSASQLEELDDVLAGLG